MNDRINQFRERLHLNQRMEEFMPNFRERMNQMRDMSNCFESQLEGRNFNFFNASMSLDSIANFYYQMFSNKTPNENSLTNLKDSIKEIVERCMNGTNYGAKFGFTELSDLSLEEIEKMNGVLTNVQLNETDSGRSVRASGKDAVCIRSGSVPDSFDWRQHGVVTPVKNQGSCGSCWTFATTASVESAYLIKKKTSDKSFDLSEQQLVDCAKVNGCQGGYSYAAMDYIQKNGQTAEGTWPYRGSDNRCPGAKSASAQITNYCVRSRLAYGGGMMTESLSDEDIKKALVFFGPLYITLNASPISQRNYRGGVFSDPSCSTQINHAVTLVGYTPNAWIIKNSWGPYWGESGFFQLARGSNMCGVNTEIAYPVVN